MARPDFGPGPVYAQRKLVVVGGTSTCKFIAGEKPYGPNPYCDDPTKPGSSYCPKHDRLCKVRMDSDVSKRWERWAEAGARGK